MGNHYVKSPAGDLDYKFDLMPLTHGVDDATDDYLEAGETITSFTVTVGTGLTLGTATKAAATDDDATSVVVWVSGGTAGETYPVTCQFTTTMERTDKRTIYVEVTER
jgi:hypothetical protein